jgi:hypothetical protein
MGHQGSEKFEILGVVRCGKKRVTVLSTYNDEKVQLILPRSLLESFLSSNGVGFESVTRVSWDKNHFIMVNDRWFHKSLVSRTGKSVKSKMYRTVNVRVSNRELKLCSKLVWDALWQVWEGDLALVSTEVLDSKPFGNNETLAARMVAVLVKMGLSRGWYHRYGIIGSVVDSLNYKRCEQCLYLKVKDWLMKQARWLNRRASQVRVPECSTDRIRLFVGMIESMAYYW